MRTIMVVALMANLLLSVWSSNLEFAIASQSATVSIGPISILDSADELKF